MAIFHVDVFVRV